MSSAHVYPVYDFFFFVVTAPTEVYTLSLHDALPISTVEVPVPPDLRSRPELLNTGAAPAPVASAESLCRSNRPLTWLFHTAPPANVSAPAPVHVAQIGRAHV